MVNLVPRLSWNESELFTIMGLWSRFGRNLQNQTTLLPHLHAAYGSWLCSGYEPWITVIIPHDPVPCDFISELSFFIQPKCRQKNKPIRSANTMDPSNAVFLAIDVATQYVEIDGCMIRYCYCIPYLFSSIFNRLCSGLPKRIGFGAAKPCQNGRVWKAGGWIFAGWRWRASWFGTVGCRGKAAVLRATTPSIQESEAIEANYLQEIGL